MLLDPPHKRSSHRLRHFNIYLTLPGAIPSVPTLWPCRAHDVLRTQADRAQPRLVAVGDLGHILDRVLLLEVHAPREQQQQHNHAGAPDAQQRVYAEDAGHPVHDALAEIAQLRDLHVRPPVADPHVELRPRVELALEDRREVAAQLEVHEVPEVHMQHQEDRADVAVEQHPELARDIHHVARERAGQQREEARGLGDRLKREQAFLHRLGLDLQEADVPHAVAPEHRRGEYHRDAQRAREQPQRLEAPRLHRRPRVSR